MLAYKLGNEDQAIFLNYLMYWTGEKNKWIYKSYSQVYKELHFKRSKQDSVIKRLKAKGLIETKNDIVSYSARPVRYFKLNI